jgi:pimeloyl-ACP methyl ester carboxylesterase
VPFVTTDDGIKLHYQETGEGDAIIFVHEFAGDVRSWSAQMAWFGRTHRCIAFNARGYTPSDVPAKDESYSQSRAADDIAAVIRGLGLTRAHVVGLSMGAFATLHFGIRHPDLARSLVIAGCGVGADPRERDAVTQHVRLLADEILSKGMDHIAKAVGTGSTRIQLLNKDPIGWSKFVAEFAEHSPEGSARTLRNCQAKRPSIYDLGKEMAAIETPTLIMSGDEDDACLDPSIFMKRTMRTAQLVLLPGSGHAINLEEPALFNYFIEQFISVVERGLWKARDERTLGGSAFPIELDSKERA